ncbi:hypothetical protein [Streptomyces sp. NPDC047130]|uniref:hypothetical protein n=1 Tax=Streptomyces sp. NPDC047130 TaxID=3155261 RepID=UPI0033F372BD
MHNGNGGRPYDKQKVARVTPPWPAVLAASVILLSGLMLCVLMLLGKLQPEEASAIGTILAAMLAGLALVLRHFSTKRHEQSAHSGHDDQEEQAVPLSK